MNKISLLRTIRMINQMSKKIKKIMKLIELLYNNYYYERIKKLKIAGKKWKSSLCIDERMIFCTYFKI